MGPHCGLVSEKIVCLDVTLKAVILKRQVKRIQVRFVCSKIFSEAPRCGAEGPHGGVF